MGDFLDWVEVEYGTGMWWVCAVVLTVFGVVSLFVVVAVTRGHILWFSPLIPLYLYVRYRWSKWRRK